MSNSCSIVTISAQYSFILQLLRSVHGALCEDGHSVAFQANPLQSPAVVYHHGKPKNGQSHPIEFLRPVLLLPAPISVTATQLHMSPMSKLMQEQQVPRMIAVAELYPVKFIYKVVDGTVGAGYDEDLFCLVPQSSLVADAVPALLKEVVPEKSLSCVRVWCRRNTLRKDGTTQATVDGDGYDLIELDHLDGKLLSKKKKEKSNMTVVEWVQRQNGKGHQNSVHILIETRTSPSTRWPRAALELEERLQPGDFVDAQDTTGKWYEAIVRDITDEIVVVHYAGWASRWDIKLKRRRKEIAIPDDKPALNTVAPLWTHTKRWRDDVQVGLVVEVRESSSFVTRPKWYRGKIVATGKETDPVHPLEGGAILETIDSLENGEQIHFLLLGRTRQVLIEVAQEKANMPKGFESLLSQDGSKPVPCPPMIRWINLYGEEICDLGTHLKIAEHNGPATITYAFDSRNPPVEIMKPLHARGAGFVRESLRGVPPAPGAVGLHNLGNSCFMNSILQCLNHIEPITKYFLKGSYLNDLNTSNPLGSGGIVATAYASLLNDVWSGEYAALAPRLLKQTIAAFAPQFNNAYQHDSHEFCSFLMDGIHEDCNRVKSKPYVEEFEGKGMPDSQVATESWSRHLLRHDSIIVDHCQGMHRSHLTCPVCGRESIKFDVYSSISVPVVPKKGHSRISLKECLEKFTEGEQLDENNAWYCPNCKKHVCALKMLALWTVPDILIVHLKRFTYEVRSHGVVRKKIEDTVSFPIDKLDMRPYILGPIDEEAPPIYELFGVSEHSGSTANSGHYTASVRNSKDHNWYRYNDSHVGSTSGDASVTGGAYLLFYQRRKGSAKWAGMETILNAKNYEPQEDEEGFKAVKNKKGKKKSL